MQKLPFKLNLRDTIILTIIILTAVWRVLMVDDSLNIAAFSNFTPLGAMALFGGAYLGRLKGFAFPLLTIWFSDILLNRFLFYGEWVLFYEGSAWVYGAFALMVLAGRYLKPNENAGRFIGSSLLIVLIHWVVTDIGVWLGSAVYPQTLAGFWACLVAAIPFERNFLVGTLVYGALLFGIFEVLKARYPSLQAVPVSRD